MKKCLNCGKEFENIGNKSWAIYCKKSCRLEAENKKREKVNRLLGYPFNLTAGTKGAINELKVAVDLMSKGFEVFRVMSPNSAFDLVSYDRKIKKIRSVEV